MKKHTKYITILLLIFTISSLSYMPTVLGWGGHRKKVTIRPIEDWTEVNPFCIGPPWYSGYWGHDYDDSYYWMWPDSLKGHFFAEWGVEPTEYAYEYKGHIKEKLLRDGSLEITVKLCTYDVYAEVYEVKYDDEGNPIYTMDFYGDVGDWIYFGFVDYFLELKMVLDPAYDGVTETIFPPALWPMDFDIPAGTREQGCELPSFWEILEFPEEMGIQIKSLKFIGMGSGTTFEPGWRFEDNPPDPPVEDGTADIYYCFREKYSDDETINWPFGSQGFRKNILMLYNTEKF